MERRQFLKNSCWTCIGAGLSSGLLHSCSSVHLVMSGIENDRLTLKKADFIFLKKEKQMIRQWVLVKAEKLPFPIGVYRFDDNKYAASYLECRHQQCEVEPEGDHLQCPCHGSEYSNTGKLQKGPAEADLKQFEVLTDQNNIYILLK